MVTKEKMVRWIENAVCFFLLFVAVLLALFVLQSQRTGQGGSGMGGCRLMIVLSGSMQPAFDTGSLVAVKEADPHLLAEGDIITFRDMGDSTKLITHRVMDVSGENGNLMFATKGDANATRDYFLVPEQNVVGKVVFAIPWAGYLVYLTQTKTGLTFLAAAPAILVAFEMISCFSSHKKVF